MFPSELKTDLYTYRAQHGVLDILAHKGSPVWTFERAPTRAEVICDLCGFAENQDKPEAERALARLFEGIYRLGSAGNGQDIYGYQVEVNVLPLVDVRWEEKPQMKRWKTAEILNLLEGLAESIKVEAANLGDAGMTESLILTAAGAGIDTERTGEPYFILVRGFIIEDTDSADPADMDVELIEVSDCRYEDNPITARCNSTRMLYHSIRDRLTDAGFEVVANMRAYF